MSATATIVLQCDGEDVPDAPDAGWEPQRCQVTLQGWEGEATTLLCRRAANVGWSCSQRGAAYHYCPDHK